MNPAPSSAPEASPAGPPLVSSALLVDRALRIGFAGAGAATAAYHFVFFTRLPAFSFYLAFPACLALGAYLLGRTGTRFALPFSPPRVHWTAWALLAVCCASAAVNLFYGRPDEDDVDYFHRAVWQLEHLAEPFSTTDTAHEVTGLQRGSPFHMTTALEPVSALLARVLGVSPLQMWHNVAGAAALFALPLVYFALLRLYRLGPGFSLFGTGCVLAFLAMSGDTHRDWGNFTLMRAWQGKCVLIGVFVPAQHLFANRWLLLGRARDLLLLHVLALAGIGLSATAMFLLPWAGGMALAGLAVAGARKPRHRKRILLWASTLAWPALFALLQVTGALPLVADARIWDEGWPRTPLSTLVMIVPAGGPTFLAAGFLVLAGAIAPRRVLGRALLLATATGLGLFLLPTTYDLVVRVVHPAVMWRLVYAIPLPLAAGLAGAAAARMLFPFLPGRRSIAGAAVLASALVLVPLVKKPALDPALRKPPGALKFRGFDLVASRLLAAAIDPEATVLAPERIAVVLPLVQPSLRFAAIRPASTFHAFSNAGRADEGQLRLILQQWTGVCNRNPQYLEPFRAFVRNRVTAVVTPDCGPAANAQMLRALDSIPRPGGVWDGQVIGGFALFTLRRAPERPALPSLFGAGG